MNRPTHLTAEEARQRAEAALRGFWPGWSGTLVPLKPLRKPLRATPFRVTGGPEPAVIKLWGPGNGDRPAAQATRQAELAARFATGPWRVPPVLGFDAARAALLMADVAGPDLSTRFSDDPAGTMARAGTWLRAFHALTARPHPFRPAGHLSWLNRLRQQAEDGERSLPDPARFAAEIEALTLAARTLRGAPWSRAVTHRDLTLSNLLAGPGGTVWGIDFENRQEDEPLRDRFSLALDALRLTRPGQTGGTALSALTDAYGLTEEPAAIRLFLQRVFALGIWANTPALPSRRQAARRDAALVLLSSDRAMI